MQGLSHMVKIDTLLLRDAKFIFGDPSFVSFDLGIADLYPNLNERLTLSGTWDVTDESVNVFTAWRNELWAQERHKDGLEDLWADWGVSFWALVVGAGFTSYGVGDDYALPPINAAGAAFGAAFHPLNEDWHDQAKDWVRDRVQTLTARWRK